MKTKGLSGKWVNLSGHHGYTTKKLAITVSKSRKGRGIIGKTKIISKKMPYGEKRYFVKGQYT